MTIESLVDARALAVHASGIGARLATVDAAVRHLGVIQLDSITVAGRAHAMTLSTRLTEHSGSEVDRDLWNSERPMVFEAPIHAASLAAIDTWPNWGFRRDAIRDQHLDWAPSDSMRRDILHRLDTEGPLTMKALRGAQAPGSGWSWGPVKEALEHMVWTGDVVCVRRTNWNRVFDLPERAIPADLLRAELSPGDGLKRVVRDALTCLGIGTTQDVADYLRLREAQVEQVLLDLEFERVQLPSVEGSLWVSPLAGAEPTIAASPVLVNPFDNLVWHRPRLKWLFNIDYRFEAYKPPANRTYGYYTLLLLANNAIRGRADVKTNKGVLQVNDVWFERQPAEAEMTVAVGDLARRLSTTETIVSERLGQIHPRLAQQIVSSA
ncbi:YcaQ family DNA glycosylase [Microbacterium sp. Sa4CUA7]|uniref:YcaQ family DNA glycosylase n=2 Tax=Microbacterium pullorum TaxID=2762236 RepID=A0ABR8S370_9MICO|nr:YcaQ family DNA glycosylase [Microbacterium pullorum]